MLIIDPSGLFNGDRLRRCSNTAQLHWPRLFLASNGFGRLEINYARIVGKAYGTFNPIPSEIELQSILQEYIKASLLFPYEFNGQLWAVWDTQTELLPRYKTSEDRRSPIPPEPALSQWKLRYRNEPKAFPKLCGNVSETFPLAVAVAVADAKTICASDDARLVVSTQSRKEKKTPRTEYRDEWFDEFWALYWTKGGKVKAREAFAKHATSEEAKNRILEAVRAQKPEMLERLRKGGTPNWAQGWLNDRRYEDEPDPVPAPSDDYYQEFES